MKIYLSSLILLLLIACSSGQVNNSLANGGEDGTGFVKDTLLSGYQTRISLKTDCLEKGTGNEIKIDIDRVAQGQIVIYAKTSEAQVKLSENHEKFVIIPTMKTSKVTLNLNIQDNGQVIKIGEFEIKTK